MSANLRPTAYSFTRYLAAKRTVDDRALNARLWRHMLQHLTNDSAQPVTVLEIGGGIGTMIERLLAEPGLPPLRYHLLDANQENIAAATARLGKHNAPSPHDAPLCIAPAAQVTQQGSEGQTHQLYFYPLDLFRFLDDAPSLGHVKLVIAHAFLDLVDLSHTLARLAAHFAPNTILYSTINFDGSTIFEPPIEPSLDAQIEALYHSTMDDRIINGHPSGDSRTGRHLFHAMQKAGIQVLDAGSSDWFVFPHAGRYPHDEAYFLHFILHTLHNALIDHPKLDTARFAHWIATRHRQVESGELLYIAHQLDYLGRILA